MFIQEKTDAKNPRDQWKNRQNRFTAPAIRYWYIQHFSKMALENINEGLKEESFHETKMFFQKSLVIFDSWFLLILWFVNHESRTVNSNLEFTYENYFWSSKCFIFFHFFGQLYWILCPRAFSSPRAVSSSRAVPGDCPGSLGQSRAVISRTD